MIVVMMMLVREIFMMVVLSDERVVLGAARLGSDSVQEVQRAPFRFPSKKKKTTRRLFVTI
jgi:hypothetical protein